MNHSVLEVHDLCSACNTVKKQPILRSVSFTLSQTEALAIVGESGCGKTMTLQSILQMPIPGIKQTSGWILLNGRSLPDLTRKEIFRVRGAEIGLIAQDPFHNLDPTMPVGRQLTEMIHAHRDASRKQARETVLEVLREVGFSTPEVVFDRYPHALSGGQCQRIMIAMAIVLSPQVLLADEPTTSLDVVAQYDILKLLRNLKINRNMSILFVSHDLRAVSIIADRIAIMYEGTIVEIGTTDQILNHPYHPYTQGLLLTAREMGHSPKKPFQVSCVISHDDDHQNGCPYVRMCPRSKTICHKQRPREICIEPKHSVACWLFDQNDLRKEPINGTADYPG